MPLMSFESFIQWCKTHIKGDEKGEAQIFLDHFFVALGYPGGLKSAGASLEFRIKSNENKRSTSFADLVWKPRVLIEMKKRNEDLSIHYLQAFSYWQQLVPNRPRYVILCNFDEFWIYDFDKDIYEPQEKINLEDLHIRKEAFAFLLPVEKKPLFKIDKEDVTETIAKSISELYRKLTGDRNPTINHEDAIRYCLQCVLSLFAEDVELLPNKIFTRLIDECIEKPGSGFDKVPETYDLIGGLFQQMNLPGRTPAGKYKDVDYFNGGLFKIIKPIELTKKEVEDLWITSQRRWQNINPAIFGSIFEGMMSQKQRHETGAHYTYEVDIKKIVDPVVVQPWRRKIDAVMNDFSAKDKYKTFDALVELHTELTNYKVLDPACGSGNFLFIAFNDIKLLEKEIFKHLNSLCTQNGDTERVIQHKLKNGMVTTKQFYGIDKNPTAVELAKVTMMIAKELSIKQAFDNEETLPLDNLDGNIISADALFTPWPEVDAIVGNPPFQSKNKMQDEFGAEYVNKLRTAYPEVPGRADFCVYWFYKTHKQMKENSYAGLVGTNTIRQNYSREGSLDVIVQTGGEIFSAVSSMDWSGEAAVFVSIACWKKGKYEGEKELYTELKKELCRHVEETINSSLSLNTDVSEAEVLECNRKPKKVFQGQTHGHKGFLLSKAEGIKLLKQYPEYKEALKPFLIGEELVANYNSQPDRFVIDFTFQNQIEASKYSKLYEHLQKNVLPFVELKAKDEDEGKKKDNGRGAQLLSWWKMWRRREDLLLQFKTIKRYIACARVTQRPIFEFISSEIHPNDKIMAFVFEDDYSFGIIQSKFHWHWFLANCTTLAETPNYNTASIWDTFPWPQTPTEAQIKKVANAARTLRTERTKLMQQHHISLRDLYRLLEQPGKNPIKDLHTALDKAVLEAYGFATKDKTIDTDFILENLLALNHQVADKEKHGAKVQSPGLPQWIKNKEDYVSDECVKFEWD